MVPCAVLSSVVIRALPLWWVYVCSPACPVGVCGVGVTVPSHFRCYYVRSARVLAGPPDSSVSDNVRLPCGTGLLVTSSTSTSSAALCREHLSLTPSCYPPLRICSRVLVCTGDRVDVDQR